MATLVRRLNINLMVLTLMHFTSVLSTNITITSSPRLGVDTVCDNQDVTLMCQTDQAGSMVTWHWSNQSQHGDTITVVARMTGLVYTCVVTSKDGHHLGNASITVVANGTLPLVDRYNFNPYILKYEGENLTVISEISSDLPLSSGHIKWEGFHRPLPSTAVVDNYTTDGVLYSRLSLYELSFEDDSGNYTNIVSNQCGTSSVSVYIDVRKAPIVCNNSGSVAVPQKNIITVKGESIVLRCLFKGNLKILWPSMSSYWMIGPHDQQTKPTYIMDNSTDPYRIAVYQTCLSEDGSCCNFTNQLDILKVPLELHNTSLTCGEVLDEVPNIHAASIMVFDVPTVYKTSDCIIKAHINDSKTLQCQFNAPTMKDITVVVWTKSDTAINSSDHYEIRTFTKPAIEDLIISELTINSITTADQGMYSCYCYYNRELVMSSKPVISEQRTFRIFFRKRKMFPYEYVAVGIAAASFLMLVLASLLAMFYKCRRRSYNGSQAEKENLVHPEEATDGVGQYLINGTSSAKSVVYDVKDAYRKDAYRKDANRGKASVDKLRTNNPMKPIPNYGHRPSLNSNSGNAKNATCSSPCQATEDHSEEAEDNDDSPLLN